MIENALLALLLLLLAVFGGGGLFLKLSGRSKTVCEGAKLIAQGLVEEISPTPPPIAHPEYEFYDLVNRLKTFFPYVIFEAAGSSHMGISVSFYVGGEFDNMEIVEQLARNYYKEKFGLHPSERPEVYARLDGERLIIEIATSEEGRAYVAKKHQNRKAREIDGNMVEDLFD